LKTKRIPRGNPVKKDKIRAVKNRGIVPVNSPGRECRTKREKRSPTRQRANTMKRR